MPASGTTATVTVTASSAALKSKQVFKVVPIVSRFSPVRGPVGTQVTIKGTGFTLASRVSFGGINPSSYTVNSATQITAAVPAGAKSGKIAMQAAGGGEQQNHTHRYSLTIATRW